MNNMFIQPCFIRKNTPELRKKLEELGYIYTPNGRGIWFIPIEELKYLVTHPMSGCYQGCNGYWYEEAIDCGTNEDMFLAIAALREDSDYVQWFVNSIGDWYRCIDIIFNEENVNWALYTSGENWHKATVEEIIEYFKDK